MDLRTWAIVEDIIKAGGRFDKNAKAYIVKNINNRVHRTDGPAYFSIDGTLKWLKNGIVHREDGPAIIYPNGHGVWYYDGLPTHMPKFHTNVFTKTIYLNTDKK